MSFWLVGAGCMHRRCAATLRPFWEKDFSMLSFLFCLRGGGGVEEGLEAIDTFPGSLESKVSLGEISQ